MFKKFIHRLWENRSSRRLTGDTVQVKQVMSVNENWRIKEYIDVSYRSTMMLVKNINNNHTAILKLYGSPMSRKNVSLQEELRNEYETERHWFSVLNHRNIVKFYEDGCMDNAPFIIMEHAAQGDLIDNVFDSYTRTVAWEEQVRHYFKQLIDVVEYMHSKGVAHGDIKPCNLLVDNDDVLKLCDFATTGAFSGEKIQLSYRYGSDPCMAPEVYNHQLHCPGQADIWACGSTLVFLLTKYVWNKPSNWNYRYRRFFEKDLDMPPWRNMSPAARYLVTGMLQKDPEKRFTLDDIKKSDWYLGGP